MVCTTVKTGTACTFMSPKGCSFNGGSCYPVVNNVTAVTGIKNSAAENIAFPIPILPRSGNSATAIWPRI